MTLFDKDLLRHARVRYNRVRYNGSGQTRLGSGQTRLSTIASLSADGHSYFMLPDGAWHREHDLFNAGITTHLWSDPRSAQALLDWMRSLKDTDTQQVVAASAEVLPGEEI